MFPVFLTNLLIMLVIVCLVLWISSQIPNPTIAHILQAVVIAVVCIWLISLLAGISPNTVHWRLR